jgi:hypothetical protein
MPARERFLLLLETMSLESQIAARQGLAEHPPERDWHMRFYVIPLERKLRELQAQLNAAE